MKRLRDIKIKIQVWLYRARRKRQARVLEKAREDAVSEADRLKKITGKRQYVLFIDSQYFVVSRLQIKAVNKLRPPKAKIDVVKKDKYVVYSTA